MLTLTYEMYVLCHSFLIHLKSILNCKSRYSNNKHIYKQLLRIVHVYSTYINNAILYMFYE